jgi:exonuclease SbcC
VRPLRISLKGIRSYRSECTIDFTDRSLVAIVGHIGAGKSTILEGITYSLYNATTWNAAEPKLLIADGVQTMSVVLDFTAAGKVWQIHRSCSRTNYPPSVHRLRCLSQPGLPDFDGEDAVNREVERLIGLSYRAFLAAVILPQGRFQTLLLARPNDRIAILEGIFRLTELRDVRTRAEVLRNRVNPTVVGLVGRRSGLLADPASVAATHVKELAAVTKREKELLSLQELVRKDTEALREAAAEVKRLREPAGRLTALGKGAARSLAELIPVAAKIDGEIVVAQSNLSKCEDDERQLAATIAKAANAGEGFEQLTEVASRLRSLKAELTRIATETVVIAVEEKTLAQESKAVRDESAAIGKLHAAWQAASQLAEKADRHATDHVEIRSKIKDRLLAARSSEVHAEVARREEAAEQVKLPALETASVVAAESVKNAEGGLERARAALRQVERQHAAAHAAEGLKPGDICPICGDLLKKGFSPPASGDLGPTRAAANTAESELTRQREAKTKAQTAVDACIANIESFRQRRKTREGEASALMAKLAALLPGAQLSKTDSQLLEALEAKSRDLTGDSKSKHADADAAKTAWARAESALTPRNTALTQAEIKLAARMSALKTATAASQSEAANLPTFARLVTVEASAVDKPMDEVSQRLALARAIKEKREDLLRTIALARSALSDLRDRRTKLVEVPERKAAELLAQTLSRTNDCLEILKEKAYVGAAERPGLENHALWASGLETRAEQVARELEDRAITIDRKATIESAKFAQRLEKAGFENSTSLAKDLTATQRTIGQLTGARDMAVAQIPLAAELDVRIKLGTELLESAQELVRLLADGQFIRHVIERRQRNLLAVASEILSSVTGRRYGFSEDFEIVDRLSGQPRPTRTLSGGETFLASLALALALVEMASRSGRQIDALFLDEGFGALDPDALDEALGALERRADQGRLVAIVSHLKEVADRIESVLEVTRQPTGSRADWRGVRDPAALGQEGEEVLVQPTSISPPSRRTASASRK